MASKTTHYALDQWDPGDPFLRTDFNEDFRRIDGAIHGARQAAQRVQEQLVPIRYNVYQNYLLHYYEGKNTGMKRALIFDGFLDGGQIASLSEGLYRHQTEHELQITRRNSFAQAWGRSHSISIAAKGGREETVTPPFGGVLQRVTADVTANPCQLTLLDADVELASAPGVPIPGGQGMQFDLEGLTLQPGRTYTFRLYNGGNGPAAWHGGQEYHGGLRLAFSQTAVTQGILYTVPAAPLAGSRCEQALAYVRHRGGRVELALDSGSGSFIPPGAAGNGEAADGQGVACTESAFRWDGPIQFAGEGPRLRLTLTVPPDQDAAVLDYGVLLL